MAACSGPFERLWSEYQNTGDQSIRAELAERFLPLLLPIAKKVRRAMGDHPELDELLSAGTIGVLEACQRFDPTRGVRFGTFCRWRALGAMYDDQQKDDWATGAIRLKAQRLKAAREELRAALGRRPSDDELADALSIGRAEVAEIRRLARKPRSLSGDATDPTDPRLSSDVAEDSRGDPVRVLLATEARSLLLEALKRLPGKQRHALLLYYFERLNMAQVGLVLGISESRVSQLHKEALATLLRRLGRRRNELLAAFARE